MGSTNTYKLGLPSNRVVFLQAKGMICEDNGEIKVIIKLRENFHNEVHRIMKYPCTNYCLYARFVSNKYLFSITILQIVDLLKQLIDVN